MYLSDITLTNTSHSFTHKMATKTSWHRYGTKLRHCHRVYTKFFELIWVSSKTASRPVHLHLTRLFSSVLGWTVRTVSSLMPDKFYSDKLVSTVLTLCMYVSDTAWYHCLSCSFLRPSTGIADSRRFSSSSSRSVRPFTLSSLVCSRHEHRKRKREREREISTTLRVDMCT